MLRCYFRSLFAVFSLEKENKWVLLRVMTSSDDCKFRRVFTRIFGKSFARARSKFAWKAQVEYLEKFVNLNSRRLFLVCKFIKYSFVQIITLIYRFIFRYFFPPYLQFNETWKFVYK